MKKIKQYWALLIPAFITITVIVVLIAKPGNKNETVIGMVETKTVDVAAEFPGRLDSLFVKWGDTVKKGDLLAVLRSTEINAIKEQAMAALDATKWQLNLLENGTSPELVKSAENLYALTQDQYELLDKTYGRMQNLYNDQVISGQEKDIVYFKYEASKKEMETAKLNLERLKRGTRPELVKSAEAIVRQAEKAVELTEALTNNTRIHAPVNGVISSLVINEGEIVAIGYPMMAIDMSDSYFIRFNIRQDKLGAITKEQNLAIRVPGCTPEIFKVTLKTVSPSLEFANWVPVKDQGQFELRTFTIECKPTELVKGLRAGMTASLEIPDAK